MRRRSAQRLINVSASADSLKVIMRHKDFATTEKHYDAIRTAQSAGEEVVSKLSVNTNSPISGGISEGNTNATNWPLKRSSVDSNRLRKYPGRDSNP
ncbi:MAG: hypothetical protein KDA80_15490 [Planctomycetaceae bacterium]|nr:hypothetical protein [Planctomycetaceae bacterium]